MPTLEWFVRTLNGCIREKKPFLAYWHMDGYCVLYTGTVTRTKYGKAQTFIRLRNGYGRLVRGVGTRRVDCGGV
jgi:hypothetical protein